MSIIQIAPAVSFGHPGMKIERVRPAWWNKFALPSPAKGEKTFLCHLCDRTLPASQFPRLIGYHAKPWACRPCQKDYILFRRYFKAEHSRFPTVAEYRADE